MPTVALSRVGARAVESGPGGQDLAARYRIGLNTYQGGACGTAGLSSARRALAW